MTEAVLTELNLYPLKSGGGTPLRTAELTPTGIRYDREFMVITPAGRHLSQRELARMALLRPSYDGEVLSIDIAGVPRSRSERLPPAGGVGGRPPTGDIADPALAFAPLVHKAVDDGPVREVTVHGNPCRGVDQGDEPAGWFSALLDADCRLVRFTGHRETGRGGGEVAFADGYPLLLISAESLADLNARLTDPAAGPLPMNRFRPNLVVEGLGAYGEDGVRLLRIGETVVELVKSCARCIITTTDQGSGLRGREPLRTLATYRNLDRGLRFGQNGIPRALGTLNVGDAVEVLEPRPAGPLWPTGR